MLCPVLRLSSVVVPGCSLVGCIASAVWGALLFEQSSSDCMFVSADCFASRHGYTGLAGLTEHRSTISGHVSVDVAGWSPTKDVQHEADLTC